MNGAAHKLAGGVVGAGAALLTAHGQSDLEIITEGLAGIAGGILGAKIPDLAEPATSSWHRGPVHSCTAASMSLAAGVTAINELETWCDRRVEGLRFSRAIARTPEDAQRFTLEILFWLALVALFKGMLAGYLSHLALDATTPRCIPLI